MRYPQSTAPTSVRRRRPVRRPAPSTTEEEWQDDRTASVAPSVRQPGGMGRPLAFDPANLIALQDIHGNHHVQRLLAQRQPTDLPRDPVVDAPPKQAAVEPVPEPQKLTVPLDGNEAVTLLTLVSRHRGIAFNPALINQTAQDDLLALFELNRQEQGWRKNVAVLGNVGRRGADQLEVVEEAKGAIGNAARGQGGAYSRGNVQQYVRATDAADEALTDLKVKQQEVGTAVEAVHQVTLKQEEVKRQADVQAAQTAVEDEKKRIEQEKKYLSELIDLSAKAVNPTDWVGIAVDAATFIGKDAIDRLYTTDYLAQLQAELDAAQARLKDVQSQELLSEYKQASMKLQTARDQVVAAKKAFQDKIRALQEEETTLVETMKRSRGTRGAAAAITDREQVAQTARDAAAQIGAYLDAGRGLLAKLNRLDIAYANVVEEAQMAAQGGSTSFRSIEEARAMYDAAMSNHYQLLHLGDWLTERGDDAANAAAFIAKADFMQGYNEIPGVLHEALVERNQPAGARQ